MVNLPVMPGSGFKARFQTELRAAPEIHTLQINIGYVCNLACRHCHVESSPARTAVDENMQRETAEKVAAWTLEQPSIQTVDFTGGSPEMNPNFRWMVERFHEAGLTLMDRCNPTIIGYVDRNGERYDWIPAFLAANRVHVVASLPCYLEDNVEFQRGKGSYNASMEGLRRLNDEGYGIDPDLPLNLVYNPNGPHLPPPQDQLEADYRTELQQRYDLQFTNLWTIANMPIKRWRHELDRTDKLEAYMTLLVNAYNAQTIEGLMCRGQISIDPNGRLYDCDFNQALGLGTPGLEDRFLWDTTAVDLADRRIATDDHCYGCTAGAGSSCGGSLA